MKRVLLLLTVATLATGCPQKPNFMTREQLLDSETCRDCHPDHYDEWAGSMHAYASEDPVFRAMNQRGQEEANLGDFCVKCHAPMAVIEGETTDGLNLDQVPQHLQGVTCYFCHNIARVDGVHNGEVSLANDVTMAGGIKNPVDNDAHPSVYSKIHDRNELESAALCGACHDIVTPKGVHLERTFEEWQETFFAQDTPARQTCGNCHMRGRDGLAADAPGVFLRRIHDHSAPAVDVAITDWPGKAEQLVKIQDELDDTLAARLCVNPIAGGVELVLRLENAAAGHDWPSGSAQDRRAWVEVVAYETTNVLFSTGVVADGEIVVDAAAADPNMWVFRDKIVDGTGAEVHMFWDAEAYESELLGGLITTDPTDPRFFHYEERTWQIFGATPPDRITVKVSLRPMGLEVLDDLIGTGHLDAQFRTLMPTFVMGSADFEWAGVPGDCAPF